MTATLQSAEQAVMALTAYGLEKQLITSDDIYYTANTLFDIMHMEPEEDPALPKEIPPLEDILHYLLEDAVQRGICDDGIASRDLFDTRLMGALTPKPGEVIRTFREKYEGSPEAATDYFYHLALDSDYIRTYRIRRDRKWVAPTKYGDLDITINLSKPEKDPKAIAAALNAKQTSYPKCLLCRENEGYAGRLNHPARQNIRLIPLTLDGEEWFLQYSPYVYYNEHCIVLSGEHVPMKIDVRTFRRLMEFITMFPHYTVGSNADLPIVGGSILTHEHFQGGRYTFAMAKAGIREKLVFRGFEDVEAGIVHWPMSVIRLDSPDPARLVTLADKILSLWRNYSDEEAGILAHSGDTPHNTITPIARRRGSLYELDLVLRNNRTTEEYPLGIFHPHQELHHIKKENIGLIEVMGLAVLPARLLGEMESLKAAILAGKDISQIPELSPHAAWAEEILEKYPEYRPENVSGQDKDELSQIIEKEIGIVFSKVLEHCGVFPDTASGREHFDRFIHTVNSQQEE